MTLLDGQSPRAPVYRNLEAPSSLLGLSFPSGWLGVLCTGWTGTALGAPNLGALAAIGTYVALRVAGRGRPEGYLRDAVLWKARRVRSDGFQSAAARAPCPGFPFGGEARRGARLPPRR